MNRGQMRLEVRRAIGELTADLWSDAEINDWLNEGAKVMLSNTQALQGIWQRTTVAGQQEYILPDDVDEIFNVIYQNGNSSIPLKVVEPRQVQMGTPTNGTCGWFYVRAFTRNTGEHDTTGITVDVVDDENQQAPRMVIGLFPPPNGANQLTVFYYARHFQMMTDGSFPAVPPEFRRGIVDYATSMAKEKEGAYAEADRKMKSFQNFSDRLREKMICEGQDVAFPTVQLEEDGPLYGDVIIKFGTAS